MERKENITRCDRELPVLRKYVLAAFLLFGLAGGARCHVGIQGQSGEKDSLRLKIVAFGNSITATRKTVNKVFAQRLPELLKAEGIAAEVINSGIPGSHTGSVRDHNLFKIKHALDRFDTDVLAHHPDLVTIGFGTNDAHIDSKVKDGPSRIPLEAFKGNLTRMIGELKKQGARIILIAPNPLSSPYDSFQNDRLLKYVKVMRKLAKKYRLGLVDNYSTFRKYRAGTGAGFETLLLDGVHPNDDGHALIAAGLTREIRKLYRRQLSATE